MVPLTKSNQLKKKYLRMAGPSTSFFSPPLIFILFLHLIPSSVEAQRNTDRWVWTEGVSLAPLERPTPEGLPLCDGNTHDICLQRAPQPMNWEEAHSHCRSQNGFLASRDQYRYLELWWPREWWNSNGNITWTALTPFEGRYQWLARTSSLSDFEMWKDPPVDWSRDCAAFNLTTGKFQLNNCSQRLHFFCVLNNSESMQDMMEDFSDIELQVTSSVRGHEGLVQVPEKDFDDLVLSCQALRKSTGERLTRQPHIFWRKDKVFIDHSVGGLEPATIHDSSKSESVVPGISELTIQHQLAQGTYWCEAWIPFSRERITSNKVLVTLKEWVTVIFNAHRYEPIEYDKEQARKDINKNFANRFKDISKYPWDFISVEKTLINSSYCIANYSFHVYVPRKDLDFDYLSNFARFETYKKIFTDSDFLDSSNMTFATFCYRQKKSFNSGIQLQWPFTEAGYVFPKSPKCRIPYGKLSPGLCKGDYVKGAHLAFDPTDCEWQDPCPKGYILVERKFCVAVSSPENWSTGFNAIYKTGQEASILDDITTSSATFSSIKLSILRLINQSTIWLPVKREHRLGPLVYKGPKVIGRKYQQYEGFKDLNVTWVYDHPQMDQDCLAINLETNQLLTLSCDAKLPFVAVIKSPFLLDTLPDKWGSLTKESQNCTACLCPQGWNTTIFKGENGTCFKLFTGTQNVTWSKAKKFCEDKGAQLPSPNVGFLDWVYRQLLHENNVSEVWMGVQWIPDRILYNGSVDNINWLPQTDYSLVYGVLMTNGWILENEEKTMQNILCQQIISPVVAMELRVNIPKNKDSQTMCIDVNPVQLLMDKKNLKCYVNGKELTHEQTRDSGCQYELKVSGQGYYQCHAWSTPPFKLSKSNTVLLRDDKTFSFVITLSQNTPYIPQYHDSTYVNNQRRMGRSKSCTEILRNNLESTELGKDFRFSDTISYYLPESNYTRLQQNFHLECEIKNNTTINEPELFIILSDMLNKNEKFGDCTFKRIKSTVGCPSDITSDNSFGISSNLTWPQTNGNEVVIPEELCITLEGEPVTRECLGDFMEGYYWGPPSNSCSGEPSIVTRTLWEMNRNKTNHTVPGALADLTSSHSSLVPADIHFVAKTFQTLSRDEMNYDFDDIVRTVSNIMGANDTAFGPVLKKLNSSSTLLEAFEELTFKVQLSTEDGDQQRKASKELISVERLDLEPNSTIIGFKSQGKTEATLLVGFSDEDLSDAEAALILPNNLTYTVATKTIKKARYRALRNDKVPLAFAVLKNGKLFQDNTSHANYTVNSHIVMASYKGEYIRNLEDPVKILFKPKYEGNDTKCVFWDFAMNDQRGGWSEEGCIKGERQGIHDVCFCNHLTNFAQLINYENEGGFSGTHAIILDIVTIIGCCLSIIGLLLVFTTFFLFKKWRRSLSNKILVNLSFSVFCSMVIFLAGINQTWNDQLCRSVAVGLHYFILASFGWMLVEAVHQYLKFVKVVGTYIPRFLWKASVCAWGIPVLPILIVLIYDRSLYDSVNEYNSEYKICWMSVEGFKYAFLPPLVMTMTVNLVMYSLIIHGAICGRARVNSTMSERTLFMNQLRMAVCVFFLLGFTWIFGLLAVCQLRQVFSYLFCIFNTLQGFFLFLFHVCREQGARKYWRDFLSVLTKDPVSSSPGNSLNPVHSNNFRGHPDSVSFDKCGGILVLPQGPPLRPQLRRTTNRMSLLSARTNSTLIQSRNSFNP